MGKIANYKKKKSAIGLTFGLFFGDIFTHVFFLFFVNNNKIQEIHKYCIFTVKRMAKHIYRYIRLLIYVSVMTYCIFIDLHTAYIKVIVLYILLFSILRIVIKETSSKVLNNLYNYIYFKQAIKINKILDTFFSIAKKSFMPIVYFSAIIIYILLFLANIKFRIFLSFLISIRLLIFIRTKFNNNNKISLAIDKFILRPYIFIFSYANGIYMYILSSGIYMLFIFSLTRNAIELLNRYEYTYIDNNTCMYISLTITGIISTIKKSEFPYRYIGTFLFGNDLSNYFSNISFISITKCIIYLFYFIAIIIQNTNISSIIIESVYLKACITFIAYNSFVSNLEKLKPSHPREQSGQTL